MQLIKLDVWTLPQLICLLLLAVALVYQAHAVCWKDLAFENHIPRNKKKKMINCNPTG